MNTATDYIITGILLYSFYRGWRKGFLKTLLGPLSLAAACFIGFTYYQKTQNITAGLGICILGPFLINIAASLTLKLWHAAVNGGEPIPLASRLSGSSLSILWSGGYLAVTLILIATAPIRFGWFEKIQKDVTASKSYALLGRWAGGKIAAASLDIRKIAAILRDPSGLEQFKSTGEFKALTADPRLKDLFSDEETAGQIRRKDYGRLLANPKMQAVFQDKELLQKLFALNKKIMEEGRGDDAGGAPESRPKQ